MHAEEAKGQRDTEKEADMARRQEESLLNPSQEMARSETCTRTWVTRTCTLTCTYLHLVKQLSGAPVPVKQSLQCCQVGPLYQTVV